MMSLICLSGPVGKDIARFGAPLNIHPSTSLLCRMQFSRYGVKQKQIMLTNF